MPISASNYDGTQNYDVAEMSDLAKSNLLINADFKSGIINQKGQTSYTSETRLYGIDNWYVLKNLTLEVYDGYIKITFPNTSSEVGQIIDEQVNGLDDLTFALKLKNDDNVYKVTFKNISSTISTPGNKISENIYENISVNMFNFRGKLSVFLTSAINTTIEIEYMKLERGSTFTGMPVWNYGVEFLKSAHVYTTFYGQPIKRVGFVGTKMAYITYELPTSMVDNVSCVIGSNTKMAWQTDNSSSVKETVITSAQVIAKQSNAITVQFNGEFGNSSWRVCYVSSVGIEFDGNQY